MELIDGVHAAGQNVDFVPLVQQFYGLSGGRLVSIREDLNSLRLRPATLR